MWPFGPLVKNLIKTAVPESCSVFRLKTLSVCVLSLAGFIF